jgi:TM2 domain-containing membrane protein YozV
MPGGNLFTERLPLFRNHPESKRKIALVFSILPGAGQFYNGQHGSSVGLVCVLMYFGGPIIMVAALGLHIFLAYNAYQYAKRREQEAEGEKDVGCPLTESTSCISPTAPLLSRL